MMDITGLLIAFALGSCAGAAGAMAVYLNRRKLENDMRDLLRHVPSDVLNAAVDKVRAEKPGAQPVDEALKRLAG